jgi:hypothetical protein
MRMSSADEKSFPRFANYVKTAVPQLGGVPVIVNNMKKFGSLPRLEFKQALSWGTKPLIVITTLPGVGPGGCSGDGQFMHAAPDEIRISLARVQDFEREPMGAGADTNARGEKVIIVGVLLLHELCHWGNFNHSVAEPTEQGVAFVEATYGRRIPFLSTVSEITITP